MVVRFIWGLFLLQTRFLGSWRRRIHSVRRYSGTKSSPRGNRYASRERARPRPSSSGFTRVSRGEGFSGCLRPRLALAGDHGEGAGLDSSHRLGLRPASRGRVPFPRRGCRRRVFGFRFTAHCRTSLLWRFEGNCPTILVWRGVRSRAKPWTYRLADRASAGIATGEGYAVVRIPGRRGRGRETRSGGRASGIASVPDSQPVGRHSSGILLQNPSLLFCALTKHVYNRHSAETARCRGLLPSTQAWFPLPVTATNSQTPVPMDSLFTRSALVET